METIQKSSVPVLLTKNEKKSNHSWFGCEPVDNCFSEKMANKQACTAAPQYKRHNHWYNIFHCEHPVFSVFSSIRLVKSTKRGSFCVRSDVAAEPEISSASNYFKYVPPVRNLPQPSTGICRVSPPFFLGGVTPALKRVISCGPFRGIIPDLSQYDGTISQRRRFLLNKTHRIGNVQFSSKLTHSVIAP